MEMQITDPRKPVVGSSVKLVAGVFFAILGVLLTLENLRVLDAGPMLRYWPLLLIVIGVLKFRDAGSRVLATITIAAGVWLLALGTHWLRFSLVNLWPLILIGVGVVVVLRAFGVVVPTAIVVPEGIIWGILNARKISTDPAGLNGRRVIAFMGGAEIDLIDGPTDGPVIIEVLAMWGGIEIRVPAGWEVIGEVVPVMGGIDIKTSAAQGGRQLIVRGLVLMAGMEIKNVKVRTT